MDFFLNLNADQVNIIIKGLENLQSGASNTQSFILGQIQAQQVAREMQKVKAEEPKAEEKAPTPEAPKAESPKEESKAEEAVGIAA